MLTFIFIILLFEQCISTIPFVCPSGWTAFNGRCWFYLSTPNSWVGQTAACKASDPTGDDSAHLADPRTELESNYVNNLGCRNNSAVFASAFDVWTFNATVPVNSPTNPPVPSVSTTPNNQPKLICVCTPPPRTSDSYWCINGPTEAFGVGQVGNCTNTQTVGGSDCVTSPYLCKAPAVLSAVRSNTGRGACWLGAARSGLDSARTLLWDVSAAGVSASISYNRLEPKLKVLSGTGSQSLYTKQKAWLSGTAAVTPNCLAMWNYAQNGTWIVDYCPKLMPGVCVKDASCPPGYYKSSLFAVTGVGAVSYGRCSKCPVGEYRGPNDPETNCLDCPSGTYGATTGLNSSTCTGVCPPGTYCPQKSASPLLCDQGFYGRQLVNGQGYADQLSSCAPCDAGKYCPTPGLTYVDMTLSAYNCQSGFCGFAGQNSATCSKQCTPGYYCPDNSGTACPGRPCGDGNLGVTYGNGSSVYCSGGSRVPTLIDEGKFGVGNSTITFDRQLICERGFYCLNGIKLPCTEGFYSDDSFTPAQFKACKACNNGRWCPASTNPDLPGSTSPDQLPCAPTNATYPAEYYCIKGVRYTIPNDTYMTIPETAPENVRQNLQICPQDKVCTHGIAYDRLTWNSVCPSGQVTVGIQELKTIANTGIFINATLNPTLLPSDYNLDYRVLNQSFYDIAALATSTDANCKLGITTNDGIFAIDTTTGQIKLNRFAPDPYNPASALQYEVCPPISVIKYNVLIQASLRKKIGSIQSNITCKVTVNVLDNNDQPIFPRIQQNRVINESASENTPAARCSGVLTRAGCPDDPLYGIEDDSVAAIDEDSFNQGTREYSFVGPLNAAQQTFKINSCTGLISQIGNTSLRFSDPSIPFCCGGNYKRINFTVNVVDDGNGGLFPNKTTSTVVSVYLLNINDPPVFLTPSTTTFYIPESTSAGRYPAGTRVYPQINVTDDDPQDTHIFSVFQNPALAFTYVSNQLVTSTTGAVDIDYETTKSYSIQVAVEDNGSPKATSIMPITINVVNINDPPVIEQDLVFFVRENAAAGTPVCKDEGAKCLFGLEYVGFTDPDEKIKTDIVTLRLSNNAGGKFVINATSGLITVAPGANLNFEDMSLNVSTRTGRAYSLQVIANSSGAGVVTNPLYPTRWEIDTRDFLIYVVDENENPQFVTSNATAFRIVETFPVGIPLDVASIRASDPDNADTRIKNAPAPTQDLTFSISPTSAGSRDGSAFFSVSTSTDNTLAVLSLKAQLNYQNAPDCSSIGIARCYQLRLRVVDNGSPQGVAEQIYTFEVLNVNEGPSFASQSYFVSISEDQSLYSSQVDCLPTGIAASDPDIGGNAKLTYSIVSGEGDALSLFGIVSLGPSNGFKIVKKANALLNYESKSTFFLRVRASDTGGSSAIGKACILDQGFSAECGDGSFCFNSRCYETCVRYQNATTILQPDKVPRIDGFFCKNMTGIGGLVPLDPFYVESAQTTVYVTINDQNDPPFIVFDSNNPQPDIRQTCSLFGVISKNSISRFDQYVFRDLPVWDDDALNVGGLNAGPFTFAKVGTSNLWNNFNLTNTTLGTILFPQCNKTACSIYQSGQTYSGQIRVTDQGGLSTTCSITVNITLNNIQPFLEDAVTLPLREDSADLTIVRNGFSFAQLAIIDPGVLDSPPENLTFSTTFNTLFAINSLNGQISLKTDGLDYESLQSVGFVKKVVLRVVDSYGSSSSAVITIPIEDVNEAPYWVISLVGGAINLPISENTPGLTNITNFALNIFDPDIYAVNPAWRTLSLSLVGCSAPCPFEFIGTTLRIKSGASLDFEAPVNSWSVQIVLSDGAGLTSSITANIFLLNVNEPPFFTGTGVVSVPEGFGGVSGLDLLDISQFVSDIDANDPPSSFRLNITSGNIGSVFEVVGGKLRIAPNQNLDFETRRTYNMTILVSDVGGLTATGFVSVQVKNINDVTISSIAVNAGPLVGSNQLSCLGVNSTVRIIGTNFGMNPNTPVASVSLRYRRSVSAGQPSPPSFSAASCSIVVPNTVIDCVINSGSVGASLIWNLTISIPSLNVSDSFNNFASSISFPAPSLISTVGTTLMNTAGKQTIVLRGSCLGSPSDQLTFGTAGSDTFIEFCDFSPTCRQITSNCATTSTTGANITCTSSSPSGLGATTKFRVKIATQLSSQLSSGSFAPPVISALSHSSLKTSGDISGTGLNLTGSNFGDIGTSPSAAYLNYTLNGLNETFNLIGCVVTVAFVQVTCTKTDEGFGANLTVFMTFGDQTNTLAPKISFEAPTVTGVETDGNAASPTVGGMIVTLSGTSFGPRCGIPGESSSAGAKNCQFISASYTKGTPSVTTGLPIVYHPIFCAIVDQEVIQCTTVEGTGAGHVWSLIVGGQQAFVASDAGTTKYAAPVVGSYEGEGRRRALTSGFQNVILVGGQFGPIGAAPIVAKYGNEQNKEEFTALSCRVFQAHEKVICNTTVGAGDALGWKVYVDGQESRAQLSDYGPPRALSVVPSTGLSCDGQTTVTLHGFNFGPPGSTAFLEKVSYGPITSPSLYDVTSRCTVEAHERLSCGVAPGVGEYMTWNVIVRGLLTTASTAVSDYATPIAISMDRNTSRTAGGIQMKLLARNIPFCDSNAVVQIQFGNILVNFDGVYVDGRVDPIAFPSMCVPGISSSFTQNRYVQFTIPEMTGSNIAQVSIRVTSVVYEFGSFTAAQSFTFRYGNPVINDVYAEPGSTSGEIVVTLSGNNFCASEACCRTYLNGAPATQIVSHSHTSISLLAPGPGFAYVICPDFQTPIQIFSSQNPYIYGAVRVSDFLRLDQARFNTVGDEQIYIFTLFATLDASVFVGGVEATVIDNEGFPCDTADVSYIPDTIAGVSSLLIPGQLCFRIKAQVPPGQGLQNDIVVQVQALKSRADDVRFEYLSYNAPVLSSGTGFGISYATIGDAALVTVTGTNIGLSGKIIFGAAGNDGTVREISCDSTSPGYAWTHTTATCSVPPGEGASLGIRVVVGTQISNILSSTTLSYLAPTITGLSVPGTTDDAADTIGGQVLLITGINFGRNYNSTATLISPGVLITVNVGLSRTCAVLESSHTYIRCTIPAGDGTGYTVSISRSSQSAISPVLFNYGRPFIYALNPPTAPTNALDSNGNPIILQITGKNFGTDELQVIFGTVNGPVSLGVRSGKNFIDKFLYPGTNHTSLRILLPSYFGKNLNVTVIVNKQSSIGGPTFSYNAPVVGNISTSTGGITRNLAELVNSIDNQEWSSLSYGSCLHLPNSTSADGTSTAYKTFLEIHAGGSFTRKIQFYFRNNYTSLTAATCADFSTFLGESTQTGIMFDHGEHPDVGCLRLYEEIVSSTTGYPMDAALYPQGGFGYYMVSGRKDLFLSFPSFSNLGNAIANADKAIFPIGDVRSATLTFGLPPQTLKIVPTSGCFGWEQSDAYKTRVDALFLTGGSVTVPRICVLPSLISVIGENFGNGLLAPPGALRVYLIDQYGIEYEASTTSSAGNHELVCSTDVGCLHSDNLITFQTPFGSGRGLSVKIVVGNQNTTTEPIVDYFGPSVTAVNPGTLNSGYSFMNANGKETIRIIGNNLGYTDAIKSVVVNGRPCSNVTWVNGFADRNGQDSLSCTSNSDVAGLKSLFVCVGNQGEMTLPHSIPDEMAAIQFGQANDEWSAIGKPDESSANTLISRALARCPNNFYGRSGEICLPCPIGAVCDPGFSDPIPKATFAIITMAANSTRALQGSCKPERIDISFRETYPSMVFYPNCEQVVRCVPEDSCLEGGICAPGYQYQKNRCNLIRSSPEFNNSNSCQVYFDPVTLAWTGNDMDCRKSTPGGGICSHANPEDCASCVVTFTSPNKNTAVGTCVCSDPPRCALCSASTHYRLNNACVKCPDQPGLVFSLFILAGIACIALAYYLQKRKINLAFLSVGVDYFQVLAVLSTTNVPWPEFIRYIFTIFTLFLASIDIAAPECLIPNLEFPTKFYMTELVPLLALLILLLIHAGYTVHKVYKLGKRAKWLSHVSRLIGIYVLILYVLYLSVTKKALDVFNCNPLDPDDGYSYTSFSSLSCDGGGLCRCNDPGGLQVSLVTPAIFFLAFYTFGFPLFVFYIVTKYRKEIQEDQYLRANRLGERRETNPRSYEIRKRYQLMYMYFKPQYSFWMLSILGRKFGVAFASLMFRGNPSFQLAVILSVLFVAFTAQVSLRPFMSPGEFPVVVKELNDKSRYADEDPERYAKYRDLFRKVQESMRIQNELIRKEKMVRHKMGAGFWEESREAAREHDRRSATEKYFFDLNAVEAVLLGSTIIISLSGIMFESGRFQTREDLVWQADLVVVLVFIVLFGSLIYYALVFVNEIWPYFFARWCGRCFLRYQDEGITKEDLDHMKDNEIVLDANPLFAATGPVGDKSKSLQKEIEASKEALALAKRQNEELKRLKSELSSGGAVTAKNPLALRELTNSS